MRHREISVDMQPAPSPVPGKSTAARHLLVEYWDCEARLLDDAERLLALLREAARAAGTTVIHEHSHRFSPQGVSAVVVIQESHLSIHTWPEAGYAAVDFYTCGDGDPLRAHRVLLEGLGCRNHSGLLLSRGLGHRPQAMTAPEVAQ